MEHIRQHHNLAKRHLIQEACRVGYSILDVGCGCGGDLQKWNIAGANINMCDPDETSLQEAKRRATHLKIRVNFYHGDITASVNRKYDVICYNFSLQYIFASSTLFFSTLREIKQRIKPGGKLIGIIPNSERIIQALPYKDDLGNFMVTKNTPSGQFGEKVYVHLVDTPYYEEGPRPEPLAYKDMLVTHLENIGFRLEVWQDLDTYDVSKLYSKFIFVYRK